MGHKEHGGTWHMEAAQLDTQRKKGEAILKTSSTVHSTGQASTRSSWKSKSNPKNVASPLTSFDPKPNPLSSTLGKGWLGIEKPNIKRSLDTRSFKS
ncbi:unnamed protein product [Microthlaspi erraticum]|uniref:Uncharacterized protein n=1 Tax=Microthlaspi erraticum TaxID=1685480 RepID=A0A6D2JTB3_9BRAS|nr:unnamed protein product [Microthlaspi erraticum]